MNTIEESQIWKALHEVIDPEIGCNIVDLGLIYGLAIAGANVTVKMSLTTAGCPMAESLAQCAQLAMLNVPGVEEAEVEIVWDPPWHPSMMTETGRAAVGMR